MIYVRKPYEVEAFQITSEMHKTMICSSKGFDYTGPAKYNKWPEWLLTDKENEEGNLYVVHYAGSFCRVKFNIGFGKSVIISPDDWIVKDGYKFYTFNHDDFRMRFTLK